MARKDWSLPFAFRGTAVVKKTRSPTMIGEDHPLPGIAAFQATFLLDDHSVGSFDPAASPCPVGPRNSAQSPATSVVAINQPPQIDNPKIFRMRMPPALLRGARGLRASQEKTRGRAPRRLLHVGHFQLAIAARRHQFDHVADFFPLDR